MEIKEGRLFCYVCVFIFIMHFAIILPLFVGQKINNIRLYFLIIHNILALFIYIYIVLIKKLKGTVKYDSKMSSFLLNDPFKYCDICDNYKPERSHHCSKCRRCIRKMDHHCRWLGVCINNDNIAYFIRLLFFSVVDLTMVASFCLYCISTMNYKYTHEWICRSIGFFIFIIGAIAGFTSIAIGLFLVERFSLVVNNITYIENSALEDYIGNQGLSPSDSPYNLGWYKNLRIQLGSPLFLYLYGEYGDGIVFEKRFECDDWPPYRRQTRCRRRNPADVFLQIN